MRERGDGARLAGELLNSFGLRARIDANARFTMDDLDGNLPVEFGLLGEVDLTHAATADAPQDMTASQLHAFETGQRFAPSRSRCLHCVSRLCVLSSCVFVRLCNACGYSRHSQVSHTGRADLQCTPSARKRLSQIVEDLLEETLTRLDDIERDAGDAKIDDAWLNRLWMAIGDVRHA